MENIEKPLKIINIYSKLYLTKEGDGDLKNRIKKFRKTLGLSQYRLGKRVGISRISINQIETEKTIPNLRTANKIANTLGVCIYQVFDLDGTERYKCLNCECSYNNK